MTTPEGYKPSPDLQTRRNDLAGEIKEMRQQRDEIRANEKTIVGRVKKLSGFSDADQEISGLKSQADAAITDRKSKLDEERINERMATLVDQAKHVKQLAVQYGDEAALQRAMGLCDGNIDFVTDLLTTTQAAKAFEFLGVLGSLRADIRRAVLDVVENHRLALDEALASESASMSTFKILELLSGSTVTETQQKIGQELFLKHASKALGMVANSESGIDLLGVFVSTYRAATPSQAEFLRSCLAEKPKIKLNAYWLTSIWERVNEQELAIDTQIQTMPEKSERLLMTLLEILGVDYAETINSWENSHFELPDEGILSNLRAALNLEKEHPGLTKKLQDVFDIYDIARYPTELLLRQFEERDQQMPYGIIVYPKADHSGAFSSGSSRDSLSELAQVTRGHFALRLYEVQSKVDIARVLLAGEKKFGDQHRISFAVIAGHGTPEGILFGAPDKIPDRDLMRRKNWSFGMPPVNFTVSMDNFIGPGVKKAKRFFVDNPSIVLASCSTGKEDGFAQALSQLWGATVYAPDDAASSINFSASLQGDSIQFSPTYRTGRYSSVDTKTYAPSKLKPL